MKKLELIKIINDHKEVFIDNIAYELERSHDRYFDDFGFPMFGTTSKEYHEQVYFESYLELYTRKMINGILRDLLEEESFNEFHWPEIEYKGIYNGYTNSECEKVFSYEFIDYDTNTGYRYTSFYYDEIDELLKNEHVDRIKLVVWKSESDTIGFEYGDERVEVINVWELFKDLFYELEEDEKYDLYTTFINGISDSVERANSMISLSTLPGFTRQYIHNNREKVRDSLVSDIKKIKLFSVNNEKFKKNETYSKQLIDVYGLSEYFLEEGFDRIFVGKSNFAKSFLTSEYLYRYFKKNPMFDYTPIVSGYLKSIEQLLYSLCLSYRNLHDDIQFDLKTLKDYTNFIKINENMLRSSVQNAKCTIVSCLNSYRIESRNNLFHKDYFNDWNRVEQIRKNTIFLYVTLLGAVDLHECPIDLKILDEKYDNLFKILDESNHQYYDLIFKDEKFLDMEKERRMTGIIFDKYGQTENEIRFTKFDYDHYVTVEVSKKHMPEQIWEHDVNGKDKKRIL